MKQTLRAFLKRIPGLYQLGRWVNARRWQREEAKRRLALRDRGVETAQLIQAGLEQTDLRFFITYGSLLGLKRQGKFLSHDSDLDFGLLLRGQADWLELQTRLRDLGFETEHYFQLDGRVTEMTFKREGLSVDFFAYEAEEREGKLQSTVYLYQRYVDEVYEDEAQYSVYRSTTTRVDQVERASFAELTIFVPAEAERYLAEVYTDAWRIPNPQWKPSMSLAYAREDGLRGRRKQGALSLEGI